jgi:putative secretion ATPase (PEP-CTERM system associated)
MYEAFYGLSNKPFQLNPDPGFYFGSKQHRRAKAYLEYGVQRSEGFIVITGEVGAGKTTVVRGLLASLDADKVVAANLVTTQLDAEDTLRLVGAAFGVRIKDASKAEVLMALEAFLVSQVSQGKRCLLIVDEAQNLTRKAVEELRMLSNFQFGQQALLQTFLVGQPEFRAILQSPDMQQLRQRVTATCHIGPLDRDETQGYIEHRLKCAGANGRPGFDAPAMDAIFAASGGIPRRINLLCDRLLLLGFLGDKADFGAEDVNEVVSEMQEESKAPDSRTRQPVQWASSPADALGMPELLDVESTRIQVTPGLAEALSSQIDTLGLEQYDGRLRRLERSMLRLERINLESLVMLKKLVLVAGARPQEGSL